MSRTARPRWPSPFAFGPAGLVVDGVAAADLAERFGTPLYVTAERRLRANARALRTAFERRWPTYRLLYAVKANNNRAIVRILREEGCGADCSSPAEIRIAREAGVPPAETLYTAAYPSADELRIALDAGLNINLDDPGLLGALLSFGRPRALSFRLNPGRTEYGREGLKFAGPGSKFGTPYERAVEGYRAARRAGIERFGLHTMPGSNVLRSRHFRAVGQFLGRTIARLREEGIEPIFADAGGGLGVPYRPEERPLDLDEVAGALTSGVREAIGRQDGIELWNEPGRYLVCDTTVLLTRVTHVKPGRPTFVGVDAGMQTLLRPALYGAYHSVYPVERRRGPAQRVTVTGPICENTDVLAKDRELPPLRTGDLLAIGQAGAYGFSMASQYNTRPRPAELLVRSGRSTLIRPREGYADIVRGTPRRSGRGRR